MNSGKLISLLKTFNKAELNKFEEFVSSPYFNKNSNIPKLIGYIKKYSVNYESSRLEKETAYTKIFNSRKYNDKVMKNLMTETLRLGERFLEQTRYEKNNAGRNNNLLEELLHRKLYNIFSTKFKEADELSAVSLKDEAFFYNNLNLYSIKHDFELYTSRGIEKLHEDLPIDYLLGFFFIWYFKYNVNLLNRGIGYNFEADLNFIENVLEYINSRDFKNKSIIMLYYYSFMISYKHDNENYFHEYRKLLEKNINQLSSEEKYNLYTAAHSYCMRKISAGETKFRNDFFEISKDMVLTDAYSGTAEKIIHPLTYKALAKSGVHAGQFEWSIDFLNKFRQKLQPEFRDNVYNFCLAYCYFMKKDYVMAQKHLSVVNYENVYDKIEVKRLLMQLYYETGITEELISLTDTFKHFLHNDRLVAGPQKEINLNFINFLNSLYKLKSETDSPGNANRIKHDLEVKKTYEKIWLLEKLGEIEIGV